MALAAAMATAAAVEAAAAVHRPAGQGAHLRLLVLLPGDTTNDPTPHTVCSSHAAELLAARAPKKPGPHAQTKPLPGAGTSSQAALACGGGKEEESCGAQYHCHDMCRSQSAALSPHLVQAPQLTPAQPSVDNAAADVALAAVSVVGAAVVAACAGSAGAVVWPALVVAVAVVAMAAAAAMVAGLEA